MPTKITQETSLGDILHRWTIQEYERHDRSVLWYVLMISVALILVIYAVVTGNFLFALVIVLAAIILFLQSHQEPPQVLFQITELGITINNRFYTYSELVDFYVIYNPPEVKTLFIETKSTVRPLLRVPLLDQDPNEVRMVLLENLPEDTEKENEPLADKVARNWQIH